MFKERYLPLNSVHLLCEQCQLNVVTSKSGTSKTLPIDNSYLLSRSSFDAQCPIPTEKNIVTIAQNACIETYKKNYYSACQWMTSLVRLSSKSETPLPKHIQSFIEQVQVHLLSLKGLKLPNRIKWEISLFEHERI